MSADDKCFNDRYPVGAPAGAREPEESRAVYDVCELFRHAQHPVWSKHGRSLIGALVRSEVAKERERIERAICDYFPVEVPGTVGVVLQDVLAIIRGDARGGSCR